MPLNTQSLDRILRTETTVSATITSNTAFTLPSAANMAGKLYTIYNPSASTANVLVNASDASLVVTVQPGTAAVVTPISDTPVTNAAWMVVSNGVNASGIKGDTSGSAKAAGYVGEFIERNVTGAVSITSGTIADVDSTGITLTAGVWDISGAINLNANTGTTVSSMSSWVGTASGNTTTGRDQQRNWIGISSTSAIITAGSYIAPLPTWRVNISTPTTYYLKAQTVFAVSTLTATGNLRATRIA